MKRALLLIAVLVYTALTTLPASAQTSTLTPFPTLTATLGCDYFQTGCGSATPVPLPTGKPTMSIPTPTFIAKALPLPPFPAVYDPNTTPNDGLHLSLTGDMIVQFTWNMALYGVQMWNYYLRDADGHDLAAMDAAKGVLLLVVLFTLLNNIFHEFRPNLAAAETRWYNNEHGPADSQAENQYITRFRNREAEAYDDLNRSYDQLGTPRERPSERNLGQWAHDIAKTEVGNYKRPTYPSKTKK